MLKKTFTLILLLLLTSCGYEAIHSKKNSVNYDFSISELTFVGERNVNLKIKEKLNNYILNKKDKNFILKISSSTEKVVIAKNTSGDPTNFQSTIIVNVEVLMGDNFKNNFRFIENFKYSNIKNKLDLKKYENDIKNNLAETITYKLVYKLSSI
ncbi:hypothetical protein N9517_00575 [Candidatus Pelagibacter sp.]|nr:hypothetical protein [Candidatus Pelagibacter sp.]|tara:strand:+ start:1522 stop:1983 length:462 start_codon:yes stop_codon:yes gene_type:complete